MNARDDAVWVADTIEEQRREIERLRGEVQALKHGADAENERLREALREARQFINDFGPDDIGTTTHDALAMIDAALGDIEQIAAQKPENLNYCPIDGKQCDCIMPCSIDSK